MKIQAASSVERAPIPISHTRSSVAVPPDSRSRGHRSRSRPARSGRRCAPAARSRRRCREGRLQVGAQVVDRLDPDGQPHQAGRTASGDSATEACVIGAGSSISDSTAPSDSASVKRRVASANRRAWSSPPRSSKLSMAPGARIWRWTSVGRRMVGKAGVVHALHGRAVGQPQGEDQRIRRGALHPNRQRTQAAHDEEAVERARNRAGRVLVEAQPLGQLVGPGHDEAADDVRMAA